MQNLTTPVLFLIFNRPEPTALVFEEIKKQQPQSLFVAADGPRKNKPGEKEACIQTRQLVLEAINWECDVKTFFQDENLGCGKAVSSAIDWFFENVEEGIILEDDCLPHDSFFTFCSALLKYYRNDEDVMHINGSNYQQGYKRGDGSYYFSRFAHIWGWASWRRAWEKYDFSLQSYKGCPKNGLNLSLIRAIDSAANKKIDTWDTQWFFSVWCNEGLVITPNTNLITNLGMGKTATHTKRTPSWFKKMKYGKIERISHPSKKQIDQIADKFTSDTVFTTNYLKEFIKTIYKIIIKR